jgi:hypothetical protein
MLILELSINGKKMARAGRDDMAVLSSCVTAVGVLGRKSKGPTRGGEETDIHVHLGGLTAKKDSSKDVHLNWIPHTQLKVGDEVQIRIVKAAKADKALRNQRPAQRSVRAKSKREMFESAKKYYLEHRTKYERDAV